MTENTENQSQFSPDQQQRQRIYQARINRVMDHIHIHLSDELTLEELARVANFSAFHFHRIFTAMTGEPLFQFILRLRLERAASQLLMNLGKSITDIAFDCGFSGSAPFARAFRSSFAMSAGEWRKKGKSKISQTAGKERKPVRKMWESCRVSFHYNTSMQTHWRLDMKNPDLNALVTVQDLPEMMVAYVRHTGPYKNDAELFGRLFTRLMTWAGPKGLLQFPQTKVMAVYHDDPAITDESKQRVSCCITVPPKTVVNEEIGLMTIPGGKYAMGRFELAVGEYEAAWNSLFAQWLPQSGWQCDDRLCFELYHNNCEEHPQKKSIVDICIPVKPM